MLADRGNILKRISNEYEVAKRRENLLLNNYLDQAKLVTNETAASAHYTLMKQEVDATRTLYQTMVQKLKEASIAAALRANNIRVVDQAEPSTGPYKPDPSRYILMGLMYGWFAWLSDSNSSGGRPYLAGSGRRRISSALPTRVGRDPVWRPDSYGARSTPDSVRRERPDGGDSDRRDEPLPLELNPGRKSLRCWPSPSARH